jgi:hypothetical protein
LDVSSDRFHVPSVNQSVERTLDISGVDVEDHNGTKAISH